MKCNNLSRNFVIFSVLTILSACSSNIVRTVDESSRDLSGKYNGSWIGKAIITNSTQRYGDWVLRCKDPESKFVLNVEDGRVTLGHHENAPVTYIDNKGRFKFTIKTNKSMQASIGSEASLDNGNIKIVLDGKLGEQDPNGMYVLGVAQFGYNGCMSKVSYVKT